MSSVRSETRCQAGGANSYKRSTEEYDVLVGATLVPHGKSTATQQKSLGFPKTATFLNPSTFYWFFQSTTFCNFFHISLISVFISFYPARFVLLFFVTLHAEHVYFLI